MLATSIFSFSHNVFKRLLFLTRENQGLFGKGLIRNVRHDKGPRKKNFTKWRPFCQTPCKTSCRKPKWKFAQDIIEGDACMKLESEWNLLRKKNGHCLSKNITKQKSFCWPSWKLWVTESQLKPHLRYR